MRPYECAYKSDVVLCGIYPVVFHYLQKFRCSLLSMVTGVPNIENTGRGTVCIRFSHGRNFTVDDSLMSIGLFDYSASWWRRIPINEIIR